MNFEDEKVGMKMERFMKKKFNKFVSIKAERFE